jgi:MFS family permease
MVVPEKMRAVRDPVGSGPVSGWGVGSPTTTGAVVPPLPPAFRRFWWGEAVSGLGSAITTLALQTVVLVTLAGSATQVGWLSSARWLPYLVLGLAVGALVDRVRRRPVLVVTDLARAGLLALVPLAWALDALSFPLLLVVVLLFGTASLVNDAASLSFVPRLVARADLQRAHARLDVAGAVAQTGGPALAGVLLRLLGAPLAVLVDSLSYLFSAAALATVRDVPEPAPAPRARTGVRGLVAEVREGARWAYGGSGLRRLAVSTHVWFAGQAVLLVVVVPYGYGGLDLSALEVGLVLAVAGVGALLGAWRSSAVGRRLGSGGAVICSYAVSAVGVLVMLVAGSVPTGWAAAAVLAAGQLCHGWAMGVSNSHEMAIRQTRTPDELQARTNTTLRSLNRAVVVVVSPVAGVLADQVGVRPVLAVGAVVFAAAALLLAASPFRTLRVG